MQADLGLPADGSNGVDLVEGVDAADLRRLCDADARWLHRVRVADRAALVLLERDRIDLAVLAA